MGGDGKGGKVGKGGRDSANARCRWYRWLLSFLPVLPVLPACTHDTRTPVVLYSPHGRDQLVLLEHAFEARRPDIDVRWLDMGSQEILDRLRFERVNPQADVWFGGPASIFDRGIQDSVLAPYRPVWAGKVDHRGAGPRDLYYPVYRTPAVIAFNSRAVPRRDAPQDWDDVLEPRWKDKIIIRDPMASGTMRAIWGLILLRSLRQTGDTAQGMAWLRRLDGQTKTYTISPALLYEKLARQEGLISLWDLQDILITQAKGMPLGYVFPRSGTVVIDDGIGLVRGSRHPEAARAFIDFVGSQEAQLLAARVVFRLPARTDLPADSVPSWVADVEREMVVADVDWGLFSQQGPAWMSYWDQHVRGTGKK
ncbi:MAG: iron(III) transport system substrate-binding protein [Gemmatimonadales bacterium]|jgi:iron(III) transport system substrate-binding protein|nr:iron(III) transport system substrate-binding protein [Gemmatimonadales bacterium]